MANQILLEKYANLIVKKGLNLQKGQLVNIKCNIENYEFARIVAKVCYENHASNVCFDFIDNVVKRLEYMYQSKEELTNIPSWEVDRAKYKIERDVANISLSSPDSKALRGIDADLIQLSNRARNEVLGFMRDYTMSNKGQWISSLSVPSAAWAAEVFPNMDINDAIEVLWDKILIASRVTLDNDPIKEWDNHILLLQTKAKQINSMNFKSLKFKNKLGTDLEVGLAIDSKFVSCGERSAKGHIFIANIPSEECWGMPHKDHVNGHVVATKPLIYEGNLIDKFEMTFKNGIVVDYSAITGYNALKTLIEFDSGSNKIGEVALVPFHSPISNMNMLFYSTLYDENASCHLALGRAYSINVIGGEDMSIEELALKGANYSNTHTDFMFGSADMEVYGIKSDGTSIQIFKNGDYTDIV